MYTCLKAEGTFDLFLFFRFTRIIRIFFPKAFILKERMSTIYEAKNHETSKLISTRNVNENSSSKSASDIPLDKLRPSNYLFNVMLLKKSYRKK
jgi:hypothetical protein